ncbi:putative Ig domain-containing protein [Myxococcota bacterium]|nr:putative Ig domain-containing protein [Myxococcota bacterium]
MHREAGTSASERAEAARAASAADAARARSSKRTLTLAVVACAACVSTRAEAQGYQLTVATQPFDSIAATGTELVFTNWDDGTAALQPGFELRFFGDTVGAAETLYASTNGLLTIGAPSDDYDNTPIPASGAPGAFIAPFWDDLQMVGGGVGRVFWQVLGAPGARVLVVEWETLSTVRAAAESMTFQARLHEDGTIELAYGLRAPGNTWSASIGLEDASGARGAALPCTATRACTPSHVPENTRLVFTPDTRPPPPGDADLVVTVETTLPRAVVPGDQLSVDVEVVNTGDAVAGPSAVGLYLSRSARPTTSDTPLVWTALPALPSGDHTIATLSFEVPHDAAGVYTLAAIVDPFDAVDERDETNDALVGTLDVTPPPDTIVVTTTALPDATTGAPYRAELAQVGARAPRWMITTGALPEGLALDAATGVLTGTPRTSGLYTFVVEATEVGRTTGVAELGLVVRDGAVEPPPPGSTLRITSPSTLQAFVGRTTTLVLLAEGGAPPYTWSILAGALPEGLALDASSGHVTGTPSMLGTSALTVSVTDSEGAAAQASLTFEVAAARSPSPPSGGTRGADRGGCLCVTDEGASTTGALVLLALALGLRGRRRAH